MPHTIATMKLVKIEGKRRSGSEKLSISLAVATLIPYIAWLAVRPFMPELSSNSPLVAVTLAPFIVLYVGVCVMDLASFYFFFKNLKTASDPRFKTFLMVKMVYALVMWIDLSVRLVTNDVTVGEAYIMSLILTAGYLAVMAFPAHIVNLD